MPKENQSKKRSGISHRSRDKLNDTLVNMIDARTMFEEALNKIKEIQKSSDYWTNKKKIKEVDIIKTAMWQVWKTKELEEGVYASADGNIDESIVVPILERAREDTSRIMQMEISGPDGGPLELVRRMSKEDLDKLAPYTEMIKLEQQKRLIPAGLIELTEG